MRTLRRLALALERWVWRSPLGAVLLFWAAPILAALGLVLFFATKGRR